MAEIPGARPPTPPAPPRRPPRAGGGDLFIVDNWDTDWKVVEYVREWSELA